MILGVGIDICDVKRVDRLINTYGQSLTKRIFTQNEIIDCEKGGVSANQMYAARFAAKEAAIKALGKPSGTLFYEYEIVLNENRRPILEFKGSAGKIAGGIGVKNALVSFSHLPDYVVAVIILED